MAVARYIPMSQPVKLSDSLVLDARIAGEAQERSIAGQVEFWARLGKSVEPLLKGREVLKLRRSGEAQPLSEALASVDTPEGRRRLQEVLSSRPFPHFRQAPGRTGFLIRIDEDGTETTGRFVNRTFVAVEKERKSPRKLGQSSKRLASNRERPSGKSLAGTALGQSRSKV